MKGRVVAEMFDKREDIEGTAYDQEEGSAARVG